MSSPLAAEVFAARIASFYRAHKRDLPWRRTTDPYAIWVSEVMLQQTRVETVIPYWRRWLERFPAVTDLAAAPLDDVLSAWSGLGYYSRARNLWRGAAEVVARHGGELPSTAAELRALPGIGRYTAGAIASLGFGRAEPVVDGNVARVLARCFGIELDVKSSAGVRALWDLAGDLISAEAPGDHNQGLMELGATVCTPRNPACDECPLAPECRARLDARIDELPVLPARPRASDKPLIERDAMWLRDGDRILVARRAEGGLYGGLWELPAAPSLDALREPFPELVAAADPDVVREQVLSHRRLRIRAWTIGGVDPDLLPPPWPPYDALRWQPLASLASLGLSSATDAIVRAMS